jgi:hypothetical protein
MKSMPKNCGFSSVPGNDGNSYRASYGACSYCSHQTGEQRPGLRRYLAVPRNWGSRSPSF